MLAEKATFLIVGAYAVAVHGVSRTTGDIDIWIRAELGNAQRVWRALARFGAPVEAMNLSCEDLARHGTVYQIGLPPRRIDILTQISGVDFDEAWETRVIVEVQGMQLPFLGREALLRNKRASGRAKDLADAELLETQNPG